MNAIRLPAELEYLQLDEAAQLIANALVPDTDGKSNIRYEDTKIQALEELTQAANDGVLKIRHPLTLGLVTPVKPPQDRIDALFHVPKIQPYQCVVLVPDFALYVAERGLSVIVEAPEQAAPAHSTAEPAPVVKETPQERRARWLDMFEAEEKREKRGALQRLANSENVDRSNMKKDIEKARGARDTERRAGAWTSHLVQDGKRKG